MKIKERALSLLLSMVMVLTFMPTLAFAEEGTSEDQKHDFTKEELMAAEEETEKTPAMNTVEEDWYMTSGGDVWIYPGEGDDLYGWASVNNESIELQYRWLKESTVLSDWADFTEVDEDGDYCNYQYVTSPGTYKFEVREKNDTSQTASAIFNVYQSSPGPSQEGYVTNINYYPADSSNFTFYENGPGLLDYIDPSGNHVSYYNVYWSDGDKIKVTYSTGETETLIHSYSFVGGVPWRTESGEEPEYFPSLTNDQVQYDYQSGQMIYNKWDVGSHNAYINYGFNENGEPFSKPVTVRVVKNPITAAEFELCGTEEEIEERFTFELGDEWYEFPLIDGDMLRLTINGVKKEYIYNSYEESFFSGNQEIPYEYGYVRSIGFDEYSISNWEAGNDYNAYLEIAGIRSDAFTIHVVENPVAGISFEPSKASYSEAEMRLYESRPSIIEDGELVEKYCYYLPFNLGDKLTVEWADGTSTDYTYEEYECIEDNYTYNDRGFLDNEGDVIPYYISNPKSFREFNDYYNDQITVGQYDFYLNCKDQTVTFSVEVTESSEEDIELFEYIRDALEELDEISEDIDYEAYRNAQQDELEAAYDKAYDAIGKASSKREVDAALATYRTSIASVKTAAQMAAEEAARRAAEAAAAAAAAASATAAQPVEIIDLPAVKISKPAAAKKKLTVKWKKVNKKNLKKISGIQIQVATDPGFTNIVKTATVGKKKTSKKIGGLQPKTKYYVRIRAYGVANHFSAWKGKSAKVK